MCWRYLFKERSVYILYCCILKVSSVKLDIKTSITIVTFIVTMAGFYYTTQHRLDALEKDVSALQKKVKNLKRVQRNK